VIRLRGERGQAVVELALVLPVILVIVIGVFDFGTAFNIENNVSQLANEAARFAAVGSCPGCVKTTNEIPAVVATHAASTALKNGSGGSTGTDQPVRICLVWPSGAGKVGDPVKAVVETNYRWLPFLKLAKSKIYASATMRVEQDYDSTTTPYTHETLTVDGDCPSYVKNP
jgi:Flp pilus assembly protein TadG